MTTMTYPTIIINILSSMSSIQYDNYIWKPVSTVSRIIVLLLLPLC